MTTTDDTHAAPVPTGLQLTTLDDAFRADPYPALAELRERDPVHYDAIVKRWVVTRYEDVDAILRDRTWGADARKAEPGTYMALFAEPREAGDTGDMREPSMLMLDAPDHTRLRALVNKAFTPRAVERLAPRIQQIVDELLDAIPATGRFDLIASFAGPLPTIVIAEMLGVDPKDRNDFKRWSDDGVEAFNPAPTPEIRERVGRAMLELGEYLRRAIDERRAHPGDDLISALIAVEESGDQLTTDEIVTMCGLLLAAGNVTTTDLIGNGTLLLLRNPDQLQKLRDNPALIEQAVEEMLRVDSPVVETARVATQDTEIRGCPVRKGESVLVFTSAGNRDPSVHADPDRFDIERADKHHLAFGGGVHYCLGAPLARLEAKIAFTSLLSCFPALRLADAPLDYRSVVAFRGLRELWLEA